MEQTSRLGNSFAMDSILSIDWVMKARVFEGGSITLLY